MTSRLSGRQQTVVLVDSDVGGPPVRKTVAGRLVFAPLAECVRELLADGTNKVWLRHEPAANASVGQRP
uniref:hypothetical protein n=1 Tax=Nocardia suismassiliense TaxID=2077092 RepID=UPI003F493207